MAHEIVAAADQASLRPITQALIGALEVALDQIAAFRNYEAGAWVEALEELVMQSTAGLKGLGPEADGLQVAHSAIRACFRDAHAVALRSRRKHTRCDGVHHTSGWDLSSQGWPASANDPGLGI